MSNSSNSNGNDPWAWLGLLKWSLSYTEGGGKSEGGLGEETTASGSSDTLSPSVQQPMSDEDVAFLEAVMKDGIINENDRMKEILQQVTQVMSEWKEQQEQEQQEPSSRVVQPPTTATRGVGIDEEQVDQIEELLQELRDIVEQIDYARAFCALGGLGFLLGCISSISSSSSTPSTPSTGTAAESSGSIPSSGSAASIIPHVILELCAGILATVATNNPPVQAQLLDMGSIRVLSDAYFALDRSNRNNNVDKKNTSSDSRNKKADLKLQSRLLQALSATVRSHAVAEQVFCETAQAVPLLENSVGVVVRCGGDNVAASSTSTSPSYSSISLQKQVLHQRGLFFLRALVTSDTSSRVRVQQFAACIATVIDRYVLQDDDSAADGIGNDGTGNHDPLFLQLRETTMAMVQQLLEKSNTTDGASTDTGSNGPATMGCPLVLWTRKDALVTRGVDRVSKLRRQLNDSGSSGCGTKDRDNDYEDDEYAREQKRTELNQWETLLVLLARASSPVEQG